ncbi:MAG: hypothetical protein P8Y60_01955 [Calditrichota bacterium]
MINSSNEKTKASDAETSIEGIGRSGAFILSQNNHLGLILMRRLETPIKNRQLSQKLKKTLPEQIADPLPRKCRQKREVQTAVI